jgi:hypothetical protein
VQGVCLLQSHLNPLQNALGCEIIAAERGLGGRKLSAALQSYVTMALCVTTIDWSCVMWHMTMNSTVVSASNNPVPLYSLSPGEAPVCPGRVWDLTVFSAEGTVPKHWWYPSGAYSAGLKYPRAVMQGSLHLDFKGLPYNLRARQRITAEGEAVQKASMWVRPCSRESQQEKSVEDIQS